MSLIAARINISDPHISQARKHLIYNELSTQIQNKPDFKLKMQGVKYLVEIVVTLQAIALLKMTHERIKST